MTAGLTASASVVAASLLGAQARTEDGPARVAQSSAYADPVLEVRDDAP